LNFRLGIRERNFYSACIPGIRIVKEIYNFLFRLLGSRDEAEDVAQQTFLIALRQLATLRDADQIEAWIYRIARNEVYLKFRRKKPLSLEDEDSGIEVEKLEEVRLHANPERFLLNEELGQRILLLEEFLKECRLCPRECRVNRLDGEVGVCQAGPDLMVSSAFPHFGEEPPLVGYHGSGTIFLTHCNLRCIFCQNYDISHLGSGERMTSPDLARVMVRLQEMGCHNINLVTPTHYTPQLLRAISVAAGRGFEAANILELQRI
jgi:uncharacterized Fe-S radical SAM superfamily protein PflX